MIEWNDFDRIMDHSAERETAAVLPDAVKRLREEGCCIALGFFDGMHLGHRAVLDGAKQAVGTLSRGDKKPLFAVFTFRTGGKSPSKKKNAGLLMDPVRRREAAASMGCELYACPDFSVFLTLTPEEFFEGFLMKALNAKAISCGEDFRFGAKAAGDVSLLRRLCEKNGIALTVVPAVRRDGEIISSTGIRALIEQGEAEKAAELMGSPFAIEFEIVHGKQLGRTLGIPTINQLLPEWFIKPKYGVYLARVRIAGEDHIGVANVGVKPTVGGSLPSCETTILDFDGDLYGRRITVELLHYIRPEKKFPSLDALKEEIGRNAVTARALYPLLSARYPDRIGGGMEKSGNEL